MGLAVAQDMRQRLPRVATPAASLVSVAESLAAVEWDAIQSCPVDESPVSKAREVTIPHEVVWRGRGTGHLEHFALVWFPQEFVTVVSRMALRSAVSTVPVFSANPFRHRLMLPPSWTQDRSSLALSRLGAESRPRINVCGFIGEVAFHRAAEVVG